MDKPFTIKSILLLALSVLVLALLTNCQSMAKDNQFDLANYQPIEEFIPAYEALTNRQDLTANQDYDIEQTIRIMNALEIAQANSKNFDEFLNYMARQDYTGVAPDVLEAKQKLLPILQYMHKLEAMDESMDKIWIIARSVAMGGKEVTENMAPITLIELISGGDAITLPLLLGGQGAKQAYESAKEQYAKDLKLKFMIKKDMDKLEDAYLNYLTDYIPIYQKYMKEYDALCVERDKVYLNLYSGNATQASGAADKLLEKYPNNSELMLLKASADLVISASEVSNETLPINDIKLQSIETDTFSLPEQTRPNPTMNQHLATALNTLETYISQYPDRTAPALVLKGVASQQQGDYATALNYFDQASIEYPRQAEKLTDMLESYKMRTYLKKTSEGLYLTQLNRAMMEGYGTFSPNLLKAKYYAEKGQLDKSKDEIFNHFFRRGNQEVYDGLLSDMQFCEDHLYGGFKKLLVENSFIDVSIEPYSKRKHSRASDDIIRVKIKNRSDIDFENVRLFLCIHYTDMYTNEYDVQKVPKTISLVPRHSEIDMDTLHLTYEGKKYDDITRIRAIAITDDRICWVDDAKYKQKHAITEFRNNENARDPKQLKEKEEFLKDYSYDLNALQRLLKSNLTVLPPEDEPTNEKGFWKTVGDWFSNPDNALKIEIPRVFTMIDPVFSIKPLDDVNVILPVDSYLSGTVIHIDFSYVPKYEELLPLYIYSDFGCFRADILYKGSKSVVQSVKIL